MIKIVLLPQNIKILSWIPYVFCRTNPSFNQGWQDYLLIYTYDPQTLLNVIEFKLCSTMLPFSSRNRKCIFVPNVSSRMLLNLYVSSWSSYCVARKCDLVFVSGSKISCSLIYFAVFLWYHFGTWRTLEHLSKVLIMCHHTIDTAKKTNT